LREDGANDTEIAKAKEAYAILKAAA
jgi:hypothetical protein